MFWTTGSLTIILHVLLIFQTVSTMPCVASLAVEWREVFLLHSQNAFSCNFCCRGVMNRRFHLHGPSRSESFQSHKTRRQALTLPFNVSWADRQSPPTVTRLSVSWQYTLENSDHSPTCVCIDSRPTPSTKVQWTRRTQKNRIIKLNTDLTLFECNWKYWISDRPAVTGRCCCCGRLFTAGGARVGSCRPCLSYGKGVCPSVRPSHCCIVVKRRDLAS